MTSARAIKMLVIQYLNRAGYSDTNLYENSDSWKISSIAYFDHLNKDWTSCYIKHNIIIPFNYLPQKLSAEEIDMADLLDLRMDEGPIIKCETGFRINSTIDDRIENRRYGKIESNIISGFDDIKTYIDECALYTMTKSKGSGLITVASDNEKMHNTRTETPIWSR